MSRFAGQQWRRREQTCGRWEGGGDAWGEQQRHVRRRGDTARLGVHRVRRGARPGLGDSPERGGREERQEGLWLIHADEGQKPAGHWKAIILQEKETNLNNKTQTTLTYAPGSWQREAGATAELLMSKAATA